MGKSAHSFFTQVPPKKLLIKTFRYDTELEVTNQQVSECQLQKKILRLVE